MSEELKEVKVPVTPKKKAGRPKNSTNKLKPTQAVAEGGTRRKEFYNEWPTKKAIKIKIHKNLEEGDETIWQLGDSPILRIRRGVDVIVPWDVKSLLDDAVVEVPRCHMVPGQPIQYFTEKVTRFEYSFFGELPWEDYIAFREAEKKKK